MHVVVEGEGLRTQYAYAPKVTLEAAQEGPLTVRMSFPSSAMTPDRRYTTTELTFEHVLDFRWYDFELGLRRPNPKDVEFGLIEVKDSETVAAFLSEGKVRMRPRGVIQEKDVRHFRITFNDHGTYDIVCTTMSSALRPEGPRPD